MKKEYIDIEKFLKEKLLHKVKELIIDQKISQGNLVFKNISTIIQTIFPYIGMVEDIHPTDNSTIFIYFTEYKEKTLSIEIGFSEFSICLEDASKIIHYDEQILVNEDNLNLLSLELKELFLS